MHTITLSHLLPNSRGIVTKMVEVDDTPRPAGWVSINHRSIWIHRFVREFYSVGVHPAGSWIPRTRDYPITPSRRKLVKAFIGETP